MGLKETIEHVHASRRRLDESRKALKKLEEERRKLQARAADEASNDAGRVGRRRRGSLS